MYILVKPEIQVQGGLCEYLVPVGDPVSLLATVAGIPVPKVIWTCNSKDVSTDQNIRIETHEFQHKMTVHKTGVEHNGTYTITAVNTAGQEKRNFELVAFGRNIVQTF